MAQNRPKYWAFCLCLLQFANIQQLCNQEPCAYIIHYVVYVFTLKKKAASKENNIKIHSIAQCTHWTQVLYPCFRWSKTKAKKIQGKHYIFFFWGGGGFFFLQHCYKTECEISVHTHDATGRQRSTTEKYFPYESGVNTCCSGGF